MNREAFETIITEDMIFLPRREKKKEIDGDSEEIYCTALVIFAVCCVQETLTLIEREFQRTGSEKLFESGQRMNRILGEDL